MATFSRISKSMLVAGESDGIDQCVFIPLQIEYPKVLIFKGGYDKQQIKNETRNIVNVSVQHLFPKCYCRIQ